MNRPRKRKRTSTDNNSLTKNELKRQKINAQLSVKTKKRNDKVRITRELQIILDKTIVDKYFDAKRILHRILSPNPRIIKSPRIYAESTNKQKQTKLFDYSEAKSNCCSNDSTVYPELTSIKKEPFDDYDINNTLTLDVNMNVTQPQIVYYADPNQNNCFFLKNDMVIVQPDTPFTPKEFTYNNCSFVMPVMGVPIKTEFSNNYFTIKEEPSEIDDSSSVNGNVATNNETITEDNSTLSLLDKTVVEEEIANANHETNNTSDESTKYSNFECSKCCKNFKMLEAFKQHRLLCGSNIFYECLFCDYVVKTCVTIQKHVKNVHNDKIKETNLNTILQQIKMKRSANKVSLLLSKTKQLTPSKLHFDLFCKTCDKSFKRFSEIQRTKWCSACTKSLIFKCQRCSDCLPTYNQAYNHVNKCKGVLLKCDHCDFKSASKKKIRMHITTEHTKKSIFYCKLCSFKTTYFQNLLRHRRKIHDLGLKKIIN